MFATQSRTPNCVQEYIEKYYKGGLIGIADLALYCNVTEGELYITLSKMQSDQEIKIIKRYFCPEFHWIGEKIDSHTTYCEDCDYNYPNEQIQIEVYIQPLNIKISK